MVNARREDCARPHEADVAGADFMAATIHIKLEAFEAVWLRSSAFKAIARMSAIM